MSSLIIFAKQRCLQRRLRALQAAIKQQRQASSQHDRRGRAPQAPRVPPVSLQVPTYCIWGANTGVGKTLISAGLARASVADQVRPRAGNIFTP